jgi:hypothetical protein
LLDGIAAMKTQGEALAGTASRSSTSPDDFDSLQKEVTPEAA